MAQVFISYVEEDSDVAAEVAAGLEGAGFTAWYYERDSLPGVPYTDQVPTAVSQAQAVVVILSPDALKSFQVGAELHWAYEANKPFMPLLREVTHPDFRERRPNWAMILGASVAITVPGTGVAPVVPRLVQSLQHQSIEPEDEEGAIRDRLERILERIAAETATAEAREFQDALNLTPFAGSLFQLMPFGGSYNLARNDISTYFVPPDFPTLDNWEGVSDAIEASLDPRLAGEISTYLDSIRETIVDGKLMPPPGADPNDWRPLGSNALRTVIRDIHEEMDDYRGWPNETGVMALRVEFGASDWHRVQGFCNRMGKDPAFRRLALSPETSWARDALPWAQNGRVPSFVAVHATLTGGVGKDAYLVLAQRLRQTHYFPLHWEGTMAENHMGPRKVTRDGRNEIAHGDRDLHECLLRGVEEEFCLLENDLSDVALTGFFVEAPFASVVAMFRVHTPLAFDTLRYKMRQRWNPNDPERARVPLEANVVAREPLTVANLVRLIMAPARVARGLDGSYEASKDLAAGRDFFVIGNQTGPMGFHPATSPRLLQYLLSSPARFPAKHIVQAFETEFASLERAAEAELSRG